MIRADHEIKARATPRLPFEEVLAKSGAKFVAMKGWGDMSTWGTGLVLREVSLISDRVAPIVSKAEFAQEALVNDLARRLRTELLALEAQVIAGASHG